MQQTVNTANIDIFACNVNVDILNRVFAFDFGDTVFKNSPAGYGVAFAVSVVDQEGVTLSEIDWNDPQIPNASVTTQYELDLSMVVDWQFLFQKYKVIVAANDNGTIVYLEFPVKDICQPNGFTDAGYVEGDYYWNINCTNNYLPVQETTVFVYQSKEPVSKQVEGTLYFPIGTKEPIPFTFTPFKVNNVVTGNYRLDSTTTATYDLGDGFFISIAYSTIQSKDFTCEKAMESLICCLVDYQAIMTKNCGNAIGVSMQERWNAASVPLVIGQLKETAGEDASEYAAEVKSILRCNCGKNKIKAVQSVSLGNYTYDVTGLGGTTVTPVVVGDTKSFAVKSSVYQITKKVPADTAFTIYPADTSTPNVVKYPIGFNYNIMAATIYTATANNEVLLAQLNALIFYSGIDLSNVNGKCVIDMSSTNFFLSQRFSGTSTKVKSILIGALSYAAPANLLISNISGINAWLNGLSLGTFQADYSTGVSGNYSNILSTANTNNLISVTYSVAGRDSFYDQTVLFQRVNVSIIALFQAIIDYLCELNATQVELGQSLSLCSINDVGNIVTTVYPSTTPLSTFQTAEMAVICDFATRIKNLTAATCNTIKSLFPASVNIMQSTDYVLGTKGGLCARIYPVELGTRQLQLGVYDATFMIAFCAAVTLCNAGQTCTPYSQFQVTAAEQSPANDTFDLIVAFINSVAVSNDISYARIDNTPTPTFVTYPGILPNQSPYQIPVPVDKGQYRIGIKPNYADGRECPAIYIDTPACGGIIAFNGAVRQDGTDYYFDVTYSATSEKVRVIITYPNAGTAVYVYDNGDTISILLPVGLYGTYSATMQPICNNETGWVGAATAPIIFPFDEPSGRVSVAVEAAFTGTVTAVNGVNGFSLSAPLAAGGSEGGLHTAFANPVCATVASGSAGDGFDIYINTVFNQRVLTASGGTFCSTSITVAATDVIEITFNNNL